MTLIAHRLRVSQPKAQAQQDMFTRGQVLAARNACQHLVGNPSADRQATLPDQESSQIDGARLKGRRVVAVLSMRRITLSGLPSYRHLLVAWRQHSVHQQQVWSSLQRPREVPPSLPPPPSNTTIERTVGFGPLHTLAWMRTTTLCHAGERVV